jgi:hypothetical protein
VCIGRTWHSSFAFCLALRGSRILTSQPTPVFTLARFFTRFITTARRILNRRRNIVSPTQTVVPQNTPERTPSPIIFVPPPPSIIESYTSTHVASEGALSDTATVRDESIIEPIYQIGRPPRNLVETLVQALYFLPDFEEELRIQFGDRVIHGTEFTVEDLRLFANDIVPVLSAPPSIAGSPVVSPRVSVASLSHSGEEEQEQSTSSGSSSTSV